MFRQSWRSRAWRALAILLTILTAWYVVNALQELNAQEHKFGPLESVLIAKRDLSVGHIVTSRDVGETRWHQHTIPTSALRIRKNAIGHVIRHDVLRNQVILKTALVQADRSATDEAVPNGYRAIRIPVGDSIQPDPGAVVDVVATFDPGNIPADSDPAFTVARHARVLDLARDAHETPGVLILVTVTEAPRVVFALSEGHVALVLAPPENDRTS